MTVSDLPALNASLNATAAVLLTAGYVFIKQKRVMPHRLCMVSAFGVSVIFLITYVAHKILVRGVHTPFGGEGFLRTFYYTMLTSHIILAIVIVPLVGWSRAPRRLSSVVLPLPDGPTMATASAAPTVRSSSRSTATGPAGLS